MLSRGEKRSLASALDGLETKHAELEGFLSDGNIDDALSRLSYCQQVAIHVGNRIEDAAGQGTGAVKILEEYCEECFRLYESLSQEKPVVQRSDESGLPALLSRAQNKLSELKVKKELVFLPYKAAMWDSLESIWEAANADEDCEAIVAPIPYFEKRADGSFGEMRWEKDKLPTRVSITDIFSYDFEAIHPDAIFFHNPYDKWNHVTTVHPDFYSDRLKKWTDCLVYVPYFAAPGGQMNPDQAAFPSYLYADYLVVQSEEIIDYYDEKIPRKKFLPFGSPKWDRVIRLSKERPSAPMEWREKLAGKRVVFYNTSLTDMLQDTECYLKKMGEIFDIFQEREADCLLWRPHPLFESTLKRLRPDFLNTYLDLKERFVRDSIGVLDQTPEMETAVVLSDVYLGDLATSVISLFEALNKPMLIANSRVRRLGENDVWKMTGACFYSRLASNRYKVILGNRLFGSEEKGFRYRFLQKLPEETEMTAYQTATVELGGKLYILPRFEQRILVLTPEEEPRSIHFRQEKIEGEAFSGFYVYRELIFLFPVHYPAMVRLHTDTERVDYLEGIGNHLFAQWEAITATPRFGLENQLYFLVPGGCRLLRMDAESLAEEEFALPTEEAIYTAALDLSDGERMVFFPCKGTKIIVWNNRTGISKVYDASIPELKAYRRPDYEECEERYFWNGVFHREKLILAPCWGNRFVEVNLETGEAVRWESPFEIADQKKTRPWEAWGTGWFCPEDEKGIAVFNSAYDRVAYQIDLDTMDCHEIEMCFADEDEACHALARGFEASRVGHWYYCGEEVYAPLEVMLSGVVYGKPYDAKRQREVIGAGNANFDGDCGEKVFRFIKEKIG